MVFAESPRLQQASAEYKQEPDTQLVSWLTFRHLEVLPGTSHRRICAGNSKRRLSHTKPSAMQQI